jgi:ornithine cyclodeaminase/alanine dehydrogenase
MTEAKDFLFLSDETLAGLGIATTDVIDCIETTIQAQAEGKVWAAPKASILPGDGRYMMATLAASDMPRIIAVKSVMVSPRNPARGLAGINGAIMLLDSETGLLLAVMDANWVTAVRTAGLSAVVAKRLANPQSTSVAFVGCGRFAPPDAVRRTWKSSVRPPGQKVSRQPRAPPHGKRWRAPTWWFPRSPWPMT